MGYVEGIWQVDVEVLGVFVIVMKVDDFIDVVIFDVVVFGLLYFGMGWGFLLVVVYCIIGIDEQIVVVDWMFFIVDVVYNILEF